MPEMSVRRRHRRLAIARLRLGSRRRSSRSAASRMRMVGDGRLLDPRGRRRRGRIKKASADTMELGRESGRGQRSRTSRRRTSWERERQSNLGRSDRAAHARRQRACSPPRPLIPKPVPDARADRSRQVAHVGISRPSRSCSRTSGCASALVVFANEQGVGCSTRSWTTTLEPAEGVQAGHCRCVVARADGVAPTPARSSSCSARSSVTRPELGLRAERQVRGDAEHRDAAADGETGADPRGDPAARVAGGEAEDEMPAA